MPNQSAQWHHVDWNLLKCESDNLINWQDCNPVHTHYNTQLNYEQNITGESLNLDILHINIHFTCYGSFEKQNSFSVQKGF